MHTALIAGDPSAAEKPLVRVQSACITGTALAALLCDCKAQLERSFDLVQGEGGCVLYLDQEGRGFGLVEKVAQLSRMAELGENTAQAALALHEQVDLRTYDDAAAILEEIIGSKPVRLLTNNPLKRAGLEAAGVQVAERVPIETPPTEWNREYLRVKKEVLGHLLSWV